MTLEARIKNEVKTTIEQFFSSMNSQALELMEKVVAHDAEMIHVGTDRDEIWKGWDELYAATIEQFKGLEYYKADIKDLQVNISSEGKTAWYYHFLDAEIKSKGQKNTWHNARFTGVLEKRNDQWVLVQTHVSLPESTQS